MQRFVVNAIVLAVIVGKLNEHVVAFVNIVLGILPQLVVTATGVAAALGVVNRLPTVGQEVAKEHSPTTRIGDALVVPRHGGVTQRVHLLLCLRTHVKQHQCGSQQH